MDPDDLATAVRQWVHFDNLAESLNKQITNVRNLRSEYETKVLTHMTNRNLQKATLRITGATLQYATRSKTADLSWTFLEEQLHDYFRTKGGRDDTGDILTFLQRHRGKQMIEYLKKTPLPQATPGTTPTTVPTIRNGVPQKT